MLIGPAQIRVTLFWSLCSRLMQWGSGQSRHIRPLMSVQILYRWHQSATNDTSWRHQRNNFNEKQNHNPDICNGDGALGFRRQVKRCSHPQRTRPFVSLSAM